MKKFTVSILLLSLISFSYAADSTCLDLQVNLSRRAESPSVLSLQTFLFQKGLLTLTPNGYFGPATFLAVKAFQKSVGISPTGAVYNLTRQAIKNDSCAVDQHSPLACTRDVKVCPDGSTVSRGGFNCSFATCSSSTASSTTQSIPSIASTTRVTSSSSIPVIPPSQIPVMPKGFTPIATSSLNLLPPFSTATPPVISSSTSTITTSSSSTNTKPPVINSIDKAIFISGGVMTAPLLIRGTDFNNSSNLVILKLQNSNKTYSLGSFSSSNGTTTSVNSDFTTKKFPCGDGCTELIQPGNYDVVVKTSLGESNAGYILVKGFTTSGTSGSQDIAIRQQIKQANLGMIALSGSLPVSLESVSLSITGSSASKVTNLKLKDELAGKIISGSGTFDLAHETLSENQSKIYTLYGDIDAPVPGSITVDATLSVKDYIGNNIIKIKVPSFLVSISG